jgi:MoaA/NifB/PqqE/SkfB family radical SAM enzyme
MRLYHFTTAEHGLAAIRDQRLKIAEVGKLNDPFEFLGLELSDPFARKKTKEIKKAIDSEKGIVCLSKSWKRHINVEPLL